MVDGQRTALIHAESGRHYSYRDVDRLADAWHAVLAAQGVQPGDRVAVLAQNRVEFVVLLFACIRRGAVLVPLNWRLASAELARVLDDAEPVLLLGESAFRVLAEEAMQDAAHAGAIRWIDFDHDADAVLRAASSVVCPPCPPRDAEDTTMLLYTSGSTGAPKGVMVPHRQLLWNAFATTTAWQLGADDIGTASTPFFHTGGWHVFTTTLLAQGGAVVIFRGFDASAYVDLLERFGVTVTFGVPTQFAMLREASGWGRPLPRLRWFFSGGAPCPERIAQEVRGAGYGFREGYGLTECGPNCFATNDATARAQHGTVGWPIPFLQVRLRGDNSALVGADQVGELELRGPQMFSGYFRAPALTGEAFTDDGWLRTGDLASHDARGLYRIRGRRKEMFISGGENVYPGEVEAVLHDCAGVGDVTVLGVPDARWGEVGWALVVRTDPDVEADQLLAWARTRLAGYKVPQVVQFVDALPRLGSGKIDRRLAALLIMRSDA